MYVDLSMVIGEICDCVMFLSVYTEIFKWTLRVIYIVMIRFEKGNLFLVLINRFRIFNRINL